MKSLGLQANPVMKWDKQFEITKGKLICAMSRLRSTPLIIANAHIFFNMYLVTQLHFRYGVITLIEAQERELIKISKTTLLRKLGLNEKFPRQILCA